jgi:alkanesulfonate monooxygenase
MAANLRRMRFHWSMPSGGRVADTGRGARSKTEVDPNANLIAQREFCQRADLLGIDALLMPIGFQRGDPTVLSAIFGTATERLRFMTASRPSVISPTHFVQQINTLSVFLDGRVEVNVVSGQGSTELRYYGDFSSHDERYARTDEFWTICHALWRQEFPLNFNGRFISVEGARLNQPYFSLDGSHRPYVYIGGSSDLARQLAIKHADCLMRLAEPPEELAPKIEPALAAGIEVGIICSLVAAPTHGEAITHAHWLVENAGDRGKAAQVEWRQALKDSVGFSAIYQLAEDRAHWLTPYLWSGLVPYMGPPSISLVGDADEIVEAIFEYRRIGVTQFIFQGRPDLPTMEYFCTTILPKITRREEQESLPAALVREPVATPNRS